MKIVKNAIKNFIRYMVYGERASSEKYISYLRSLGCKIGEDVTIYAPTKTEIDITRPWMIEIGAHVNITQGCTILTHGYDWSVLKAVYGDILGSSGRVKIGNNVFIGMNSIILKGVDIGSNVIIGAGSVVTKSIPDNVVAAGNPCRPIMTIEEYHNKRINAQLNEATELVKKYRERYNREPNDKALHEFFWLFTSNASELTPTWKSMMRLMGNEEKSYIALKDNKKSFKIWKNFLEKLSNQMIARRMNNNHGI